MWGRDMYRITKVLNHNAVICVEADSNRQYLILGKGTGFGKKVSERIEARPSDTLYSLSETTDRGSAYLCFCSGNGLRKND